MREYDDDLYEILCVVKNSPWPRGSMKHSFFRKLRHIYIYKIYICGKKLSVGTNLVFCGLLFIFKKISIRKEQISY